MFILIKLKHVFLFFSAFIISVIPPFFYYKVVSFKTQNLDTIVVDPGHGGIDNGVSGINSKIKEADLNLTFSYLLKKSLEQQGFKVVLTRHNNSALYDTPYLKNEESKKQKDMKKRKEIILASNPVCVISIHMNYYKNTEVRGAQVFYNPQSTVSQSLSFSIQNKINNLNKKYIDRLVTALPGDYYILKCNTFPSCIVECGFLSNPKDETLLQSSEYQTDLIYEITMGTLIFLKTKTF